MKTKRIAAAASLLVFPVVSAGPVAAGGGRSVTRPFHAAYTTQAAEPMHTCGIGETATLSVGEGNGTHLGRFDVEVTGCLNLADLTGYGVAAYTAANGDELHITFAGSGVIDPDAGTITFTSDAEDTAGTGRFTNAEVTGPGQAVDISSLADGSSVGEVNGRITYDAADRGN